MRMRNIMIEERKEEFDWVVFLKGDVELKVGRVGH